MELHQTDKVRLLHACLWHFSLMDKLLHAQSCITMHTNLLTADLLVFVESVTIESKPEQGLQCTCVYNMFPATYIGIMILNTIYVWLMSYCMAGISMMNFM